MRRTRVSALPRIRKREQIWRESHPSEIPRDAVYNELDAISIDLDAEATTETRRQADMLFDKVKTAKVYRNAMAKPKLAFMVSTLHAFKRAMYHDGCVRYTRNKSDPEYRSIHIQVIDALRDLGLVHEHRSPKGAPKMSRLLAMPELQQYSNVDPWSFDPPTEHPLVYMIDRESGEELEFDWSIPIVRETHERLTLINAVNAIYDITFEPVDKWTTKFARRRQLRPVLYSKFTNRWNWHGRYYTGSYGHQGLSGVERSTIEFNGCSCVELDYSGLHPRLLYHHAEIDYRDDPYALWGERTTPALRAIAKKVVNAAINAPSRNAAISRCNLDASIYGKSDATGQRQRKSGKSLADAIKLSEALKADNIKFADIMDLAIEYHEPLAHHFNTDAGMWLMRWDASIALDVMFDFAKDCIPCLPVHDSFIVPEHHEQKLRESMHRWYQLHTGHLAAVK